MTRNFLMNRRSMESFNQNQGLPISTHSPLQKIPLPSPMLKMSTYLDCGSKGMKSLSSSAAMRL